MKYYQKRFAKLGYYYEQNGFGFVNTIITKYYEFQKYPET